MQALIGSALLALGLVAMLCSFWLAYGLGLYSGVIAAAAALMLLIGVALDRSKGRIAVFAAGMVMGCVWLYMAGTWIAD